MSSSTSQVDDFEEIQSCKISTDSDESISKSILYASGLSDTAINLDRERKDSIKSANPRKEESRSLTALKLAKSKSCSNSLNYAARKRTISDSRRALNSKRALNRDFAGTIDEDSEGSFSRIPTNHSHHRKTSFFNTIRTESRKPTASPAASLYDFDGLADALNEHISTTQAQLQCSPYTLSFADETDEAFYIEFTVSHSLKAWLWMGILGIFVMGNKIY